MAAGAALALGACSSGHRDAQTAQVTLPPGTVTVDRWTPPVLSGPPSTANFCAALTAIYQHTAELPHVLSKKVSEDILSDYVSYAPTVIAESPSVVHSSAAVYMGAVSNYLRQLVRADLDLGRLPPGSLQGLSAPSVQTAYSSLFGYSQMECHYTIGGRSTPS